MKLRVDEFCLSKTKTVVAVSVWHIKLKMDKTCFGFMQSSQNIDVPSLSFQRKKKKNIFLLLC